MKKEEIMARLVLHLNSLADNDLMDPDRKTDQGYGFSNGMLTILKDKYFDDISECTQEWLMAIKPAYKPTIKEWREKYNEYINYNFWGN